MSEINCKHFNGYKPCGKNNVCDSNCFHRVVTQTSLLVVHLGALGAVVRSTALLKAIKNKFPSSQITWVTDSPAHQLLQNNPLIDRVYTTQEKDLLELSNFEFDIAFVIDKSLKATGVLKRTQADIVYGFKADPKNGAILPATAAAHELWSLGLDNHKKFFVNQKTEIQLMIEALELGEYHQNEYFLPLNSDELVEVKKRRSRYSDSDKKIVVGLNTGCSHVIAAKKLSISMHREIIQNLLNNYSSQIEIVLLGGPEDTQRNQEISKGLNVISSSTDLGLRDGLVSVAACDVVLTGDSLGMHMAISQKKYVVAWFGPTCAQEIELYGRGEKILTQAACAPCWKRSCSNEKMCYDQVSIDEVMSALARGISLVSKSDRTNSLFR